MLHASQHTTVSRRSLQKCGQIDPPIHPEEEDIDDNEEEDDKDIDRCAVISVQAGFTKHVLV